MILGLMTRRERDAPVGGLQDLCRDGVSPCELVRPRQVAAVEAPTEAGDFVNRRVTGNEPILVVPVIEFLVGHGPGNEQAETSGQIFSGASIDHGYSSPGVDIL